MSSANNGRVLLPSTIVPTRYDVKITPDLEAFTFAGEVSIGISTSADLDEKCKEIVMHAKELCFISASYTIDGGATAAPIKAEQISVNMKTTIVTFTFPGPIPASSKLLLKIEYIGFLNNQMAGFYRSSYTDIHGKSKIMASTQFESLDARRALPCWDEPGRKAIFGVTLVVPIELVAISNMPEKSCKTLPGGEKKELSFMDSPVMSTYLLAFCVGEFDFVQAQTEHGVLVRVYTPPGKSANGIFSLDCAVKSLDKYDDFFGTPYPLPKLDMIAIPEFAMGAMENWGLVTYREVDLLIDPIKASSRQKQRVCTVVTHELAHQWFGNLVTMAWWDDLWLNEGFASWCENWAADNIFPDWTMWDQFTTGHLSAALRLDALKSSHPIQVPINHAEEVEEVFDAISYCKGASVVRMIRAVLGMKAFQSGLGDYMKKFAFSNTETVDLWKAWEVSSGMPVQEMMKSWTEQMGFPLLKVVGENWEDDKVTLELEQVWFLSDGSELSEEEKNRKWCIPIITITADGTQEDMTFMREKTATITAPLSDKDGWVKLNAGQEVPMRVQLTPTMLNRLGSGIKSKKLPPCDRAGLLTDAYALVKAGQMKPETLLELLSHYNAEDQYIVWEGISSVLGGLHAIMSDDDQMNTNFETFARKIILGLVDNVGWEAKPDDGHLSTLMRAMMLDLLASFCYADDGVAAEANARFQKFLENPDDVQSAPADLRTAIFSIYLKNGGEKEYENVKSYFYTASDNVEKKHVLTSLGTTQDRKLKERTMEWTTSGDIKTQDFFYAMRSVGASSREGREVSWAFFQANFDLIKSKIEKASPSLMDACIISCAGSFCSEEKAKEIEAFFESHPLPQNARKIKQTIENMRANAKFFAALQASELSKPEFWKKL